MTESTKLPKPKRRWLRFSLRTFAIAITIMCVWIGWYVYRVDRQREAVQWVLENGGMVGYDYQTSPNGFVSNNSRPPAPAWMLNILDVNYFASVVIVQSLDSKVSDMTPLANLTNLETLVLYNTQVSDLSPLANLTNLEWLSLGVTQVSDLTPLAYLTNLELLDLSFTQFSDLAPLANLTNLKVLRLYDTPVSDEEIKKLKQALPNCRIDY